MIDLRFGDCLEVMQNLIDCGVRVDSVITDPPYGMTACEWDVNFPVARFWELVKGLRKENANIVVFSKQPFTTMLNASNIDEFRYELIWKKQQATNPMCAKRRVMPIHENISVFWKENGTYNPQMRYGFGNYNGFSDRSKKIGEIYDTAKSIHRKCDDGSRYPVSVVEFNNVRNAVHPTQKPVDLMDFLVRSYTNEGDLVLDPFMGSGTTGVSCIKNNRSFMGIDREKKYFDLAKGRIEGLDDERSN